MESTPQSIPSGYSNPATLAATTVLITGAGRGIGRHIALSFAQAGANIVCVSRTNRDLQKLATEVTSVCSSSILTIVADITKPQDVSDAITRANQAFGHIDVLVNNAGLARFDTVRHNFDFETWTRILDVNLHAPVNLIRHVLPGMLSRGCGSIISIGSRSAVESVPYMSAYSSSKTALLRFHQCLELETRNSGVFNYYIQPGNVMTTLTQGAWVLDSEAADQIPRLKRMFEKTIESCTTPPGLVANTCIMLATHPDAKFLSGLYLDAEKDIGQILEDIMSADSLVVHRKLYQLKVEEL